MFVRTKLNRRANRVAASRGAGMAVAIFGAAAVFVLSLAAPVTIDAESGMFTSKFANAKNDGGNGGGNGGGGNGGGGNAGGGNAGGGNAGGGNASNGNASNGNASGNGVASSDPGGDRNLLLPPDPHPTVTLALFTTKIVKRYPANEITNLENPYQAISFYSELQDMSGQRITHRWSHGGEVAFNASFKVRADHWRIWSTQLLPTDMPGEWKVEIVNENDEVLEVRALNFAPRDAVLAEN